LSNKENIEAIYPLSPMQEGMLFHSLAVASSTDYYEQYTCTYKGVFNSSNYRRAWQAVVDHNPILRSLVIWERKDRPLQVVRKQVELEWLELDWSDVDKSLFNNKFETLLLEFREKGFNLKKAPLMNMVLIKLAEDEYKFIWNFHHLLLDGWSGPLVCNQVFTLYKSYNNGNTIQLKPTAPYRNYIAWLKDQDMQKVEKFWKKTLQGFSSPTNIGVGQDYVGSDVVPYYEKLSVNLSEQAASRLNELSRQHQMTLNTIVQGAWAYLLSCYSGESDVVFGSTVSGRPAELPGVEEMVGLFINTLPVRIKINSDVTVFEWLKECQNEQLESKDYEHSPLVEIQRWSEVPRKQALFESILIFENYPNIDSDENELGFSIESVHVREQTNYPLTIGVEPDNDFLINCIFDCTRFNGNIISRLLEHFKVILQNIAEFNDKPVNYAAIISNEELLTLDQWNETSAEYPESLCLHQLISEQVKHKPDREAVSCNAESLSYNELEISSNKLSHYLIEQGVKSNDLIGLCVERSVDMLVAMLAIHKTGAAYLPLDPEYPKERIEYILQDANVKLLITEEEFEDDLASSNYALLLLDKSKDFINACEEAPVDVIISSENIAYVIYTSGSTGKPKGVQVAHKSVVNFLSSMKIKPGLSSNDVLLAVTTLSFDIAVLELFLPLICGAKVEIADRKTTLDGNALLTKIKQSGVTVMQATPATWRLMLSVGWQQTESLKVLCGGEAMPADLVAELTSRADEVWNMYGPTEATVWSTVYQVTDENKQVLIGKPISNTSLFVLDSNKHRQPVGVPGELFIGGDGVTVGYLNRDELTAERFVNHFGKRLYRTGDLVSMHEDGDLQYINRLDNQVKVRGFRIEPGEIENVLVNHADIKQTVIVVREDTPGDTRLVAYYLSVDDEIQTTQLRKHLRAQLPDYMIPQHFIYMEEFPLTPNGKIDRKSLPTPFNTDSNQDDYVAPESENEKIMAKIWQDVLNIEKVGVNDNFFELGGHSLLSMQVITRLKDEIGVQLELRPMVMDTLGQVAAQCPDNDDIPANNDTLLKNTDQGKEESSSLAGRLKKKVQSALFTTK